MVARKARISAVVDANVFIRNFKSKHKSNSPNVAVIRLWLIERDLQLLFCDVLVQEYLDGLEELIHLDPPALAWWKKLLENHPCITTIRPIQRHRSCRDPKDNFLLDLAHAGQAEYLITNDRDLLAVAGVGKATAAF